jgi:hypothetical protein
MYNRKAVSERPRTRFHRNLPVIVALPEIIRAYVKYDVILDDFLIHQKHCGNKQAVSPPHRERRTNSVRQEDNVRRQFSTKDISHEWILGRGSNNGDDEPSAIT